MNQKEFSQIEKDTKDKIKARNRASAAVEDALARYVKTKTKARSKKAALEKDAAINSPRFDKLAEYDRRDDIQEAYGMGVLTDSQAEKLEDLWDERETLKNMSVDGVYQDLVTYCLTEAKRFIEGLFEDDIESFEEIRYAYVKQCEEDQKKRDKMHEDYKAWKNGWKK